MHCSDTPPGMNIGAAEIREWHLERDFIDIGYHWVIPRDGSLEQGRPADTVGAHTFGYNSTSVGVCLVGRDQFAEAQWIPLHQIPPHRIPLHRIPPHRIPPHQIPLHWI